MIYKRFADLSPSLVLAESPPGPSEYENFLTSLPSLDQQAEAFWRHMLSKAPLVRLRINLTRVIELFMTKSFTTVIPDGVTEFERLMLERLITQEDTARRVGFALLDLPERQRFIDTFRESFNAHRCKGGAQYGQET